MRVTSTIVALLFAVATLGLSPECLCHVPQDAAQAPPADDPHACCHGEAPRAEPPPEAHRLAAPCDRGCCDPADTLAEAPPPQPQPPLSAPGWVTLAPLAWPPLDLVAPRPAAPTAPFVRGPPHGPPARHLARLQIWRC